MYLCPVKWLSLQLDIDFLQCDVRNLGWRGNKNDFFICYSPYPMFNLSVGLYKRVKKKVLELIS